eukprot:4552033-Prymnesium_polylepis.1
MSARELQQVLQGMPTEERRRPKQITQPSRVIFDFATWKVSTLSSTCNRPQREMSDPENVRRTATAGRE